MLDAADWKSYLLVTLSMLVEYTIRADRLYTCTLFLVISFNCTACKKSSLSFFPQRYPSCPCYSNYFYRCCYCCQQSHPAPGNYNRIPTTFGFVLLDRVVWPNMTQNYNDFSDEIKSLITEDDAREFDRHNNNVMYQMAPLLREKPRRQGRRTL